MAATQQTFASLPIGVFLETLQEVFLNEANRVVDLIPVMFNTKSTDRYRNTFQSFAGLPDYGTWDMESEITVESIDSRYETTIQQSGWRKAVAYTYKLKKYEKYDVMQEMAESLGNAAATTKQRYAVAYLMGQLANTATYKWSTRANEGDGQYLFSASHPLATGTANYLNPVTAVSGTTGSNLITGALSHARLNQAIQLLYTCPDDMGNPMYLLPKTLMVHPANEDTAYTILKSRQKDGTANNDVNYLKDKYDSSISIVVNPWFTDTDAWLLFSNKHKLLCETSISLEQRQYEEDSTRNTVHDACFAFAVGAKDWRGVVGSTGA